MASLPPEAIDTNTPSEVVVVTGLSGAGKSTALNALEDLGFFSVDNLPAPVLVTTLEALRAGGYRRVALGLDVRGRSYLESCATLLDEVAGAKLFDLRVLFLEAPDELLARRFSATRRPHPLSTVQGSGVRAVLEGLCLERELLAPLRSRATMSIDTARMNVHDLRRFMIKTFSERGVASKMVIRVVSFGFKYGAPGDADMMLDVRFLPNPFFEEGLRGFSGLERPVSDFVLQHPDALEFLEKAAALLLFCVPRFEEEGKSYVSLAVGCTGGRHRSVALSEAIAAKLRERLRREVDVVHRDVLRAEHSELPRPE